MSVIDNAVYIGGHRTAEPPAVDHALDALRECQHDCAKSADSVAAPNGDAHPERCFCWIGMLRPDESEIRAVADEFGLHELSVEDTVNAHQRPKLERYGEAEFMVLRPARYVDSDEVVQIGEVHLFLGPDFVITVRHAVEPDLGDGAPAPGGRPRAARARPVRGALRDAGQGRRRLRPGARRAAGRHRPDRGAGLRRRPGRLPADLPAHPRGDRVPARRRAAAARSSSSSAAGSARSGDVADLELRRA